MHRLPRASRTQRGNILFIILLAILLFAALNYAVTSSMRGDGKDASSETMRAGAAGMLQHFAVLDSTILRMTLTGGVPIENISFRTTRVLQNGLSEFAYGNANCVTSSCKLFDAEGGGIADQNFIKYGVESPTGVPSTWIKSGYWQGMLAQWPNAKTSANDVVMQYVYMDLKFCEEVNRLLGINQIPVLGGTANLQIGIPSSWDNPAITFSNTSDIQDKSTFASGVTGSLPNQYCHVYHLLIAR